MEPSHLGADLEKVLVDEATQKPHTDMGMTGDFEVVEAG